MWIVYGSERGSGEEVSPPRSESKLFIFKAHSKYENQKFITFYAVWSFEI